MKKKQATMIPSGIIKNMSQCFTLTFKHLKPKLMNFYSLLVIAGNLGRFNLSINSLSRLGEKGLPLVMKQELQSQYVQRWLSFHWRSFRFKSIDLWGCCLEFSKDTILFVVYFVFRRGWHLFKQKGRCNTSMLNNLSGTRTFLQSILSRFHQKQISWSNWLFRKK